MYALGRRHGELVHPLLEQRAEPKRLEVLVVASDRGLCGAFNAAVLKAGAALLAERGAQFEQVFVSTIGRKAADFVRRRRPVEKSWLIGQGVDFTFARDVAGYLAARYQSGAVDEIVVVFSEFVSALTQRPTVVRLLPLVPEFSRVRTYAEKAGLEPFEIEPDPKHVLDVLVPQALEFSIYRGLLESQAGEHAARMAAMESATRNTEELIRSLTLQFNRARQAAITKELMEIVSGAEALK
jgi:F-type H+-transporting ATPase subunit gamma